MQITKTPEQLAARRARVKEMIASGAVMTDAKRKAQKEAAKYQQQLEDKADMILAGLRPSQVKEVKKVATPTPLNEENVRVLSNNQKFDTLASRANQVLADLMNG